MLYKEFVVNAQECCWRALIFNVPAFWKFHRSFGNGNSENLDFVKGLTSTENVFCEEPTTTRFGIFNQQDLINHNLAESPSDVKKHTGMFFFTYLHISYKILLIRYLSENYII